MRLDDAVRGPVAVIKLDVEGMEASVIRGAGRILSRHRPAVYAEAHSDEAARSIQVALSPFGYRPTGLVFNSSPTYEYLAPPRTGAERLRWLWIRMPAPVRKALRQRVRAVRTRVHKGMPEGPAVHR